MKEWDPKNKALQAIQEKQKKLSDDAKDYKSEKNRKRKSADTLHKKFEEISEEVEEKEVPYPLRAARAVGAYAYGLLWAFYRARACRPRLRISSALRTSGGSASRRPRTVCRSWRTSLRRRKCALHVFPPAVQCGCAAPVRAG